MGAGARGTRDHPGEGGARGGDAASGSHATVRCTSTMRRSTWPCAGPRRNRARSNFPFPELNKAGNWQEFTHALSRFPGPAQNFVYADVDGNIGYHATGRLPIRKGYTGDVPVDGSSGENEWQGLSRSNELPSFYNPPAGVIVTANQNPFPARLPLCGEWEFLVALPVAADPQSVDCAKRVARGRHADRAERCVFRLLPVPGACHGGRIRPA